VKSHYSFITKGRMTMICNRLSERERGGWGEGE